MDHFYQLRFHSLSAVGLYIGVATYAGWAAATVVAAPDACPDPAALARHWGPAWAELRTAVDAAAAAAGGDEALAAAWVGRGRWGEGWGWDRGWAMAVAVGLCAALVAWLRPLH